MHRPTPRHEARNLARKPGSLTSPYERFIRTLTSSNPLFSLSLSTLLGSCSDQRASISLASPAPHGFHQR